MRASRTSQSRTGSRIFTACTTKWRSRTKASTTSTISTASVYSPPPRKTVVRRRLLLLLSLCGFWLFDLHGGIGIRHFPAQTEHLAHARGDELAFDDNGKLFGD